MQSQTKEQLAGGELQREIAIRAIGVGKVFGANHALSGIDLSLPSGQIHALVGANGAGKSTLLGIFAGRISASAGTVEVFGRELRQGSPRAAHAAGVTGIYQELTIVPALSPQANAFLGQERSRYGALSEREMRRTYCDLCESLGVEAFPDRPAGTLSIAQQQLIEIMRSIISAARVVLFDEPTAALADTEREALFALMSDFRSRGVTQVIVSHNLDEVLAISDTVTVFRDGRLRSSRPAAQWSKPELIEAMLGDELEESSARAARPHAAHASEPVLRVEEVSVPGRLRDASLRVHGGEIIGIGGLVGSGRSTLVRAIAGLEPGSSGRIWIDGSERRWPRSVRESVHLGIALIPEDRKGQGLALGMTATDNIVMSDRQAVSRLGWMGSGRSRRAAAHAAERLGFDRARLGERVDRLSGGNQQKLMIGRWMHAPPRVLLADEPTRGIDIGAKTEILAALTSLTDEGRGIVFVSSELEEVVAVSDRVAVLAGGAVVADLDREAAAITVKDILTSAYHSGGQG